MNSHISDLPNAPLPLNPNSYYEILVPDGASDTGYTSCKIKPANIDGIKRLKFAFIDNDTANPGHILFGSNTLGTFAITRLSAGHYQISTSALFVIGKTYVSIQSTGIGNSPNVTFYQNDASAIDVYCRNAAGTLIDGMLSEDDSHVNMLIEVYQ